MKTFTLRNVYTFIFIILFGLFGNAQDTPFNCDYNAYLFQNNDIFALDLASGTTYLVKEDVTPGNINAVGYNPTDGYIWGSLKTPSNTIVRIGKNFSVQTFPIPEMAISNGYVGDVSYQGEYFLKSGGTDYYVIDVDPASSNYGKYKTSKTLSQSMSIHDWAFNSVDNLLYTVEKGTNKLLRIDSDTGLVTDLGEVPILAGLNYTYGAVYFDVDGRFYISANQTGTVYVIQNVQTLDGTIAMDSNLFAFGPASASNDGARCPTAPVPQEDCINGIDDDGDGLTDCDDPSCSGVSACPIIEPVSSGNSGGLESNDRLSTLINKRNYQRSITNYKFDPLNANKVLRSENYKKVASKSNNFTLKDLIPLGVLPNTEAIESSPQDLIDLTNATELFSVDYVRDNETVAVILATKTVDGVYEHTKYICDRLSGAELLSVSTIEIKEQFFIKSVIKNVDGSKEFVLSFSGRVSNNNSNFSIESHWNLDRYKDDETFYNFQIWTNKVDDLITLGEEALELFNVQKEISDYDNSTPPPVFVRKGSYLNGSLELEIVNGDRSNNVVFDAGFKRTETSQTEFSNSNITLDGEYLSNVKINTGNIFDIGFRLENENNKTPDDLFMSDGSWGVDDSASGTQVDKFEISQNSDLYSGDGFRVDRNITLDAKTKSYVAAYRSFTPTFKPISLNNYKVLEFDANGIGELEITIQKKNIDKWEDQFRTTITLNENNAHFAIPLEYFKSNSITDLDLSDAVSIVFTLSSDGVETVDKKLDLSNIEFNQRALSTDNQIIEENQSLLSPNPMSLKAKLRFYSEVSAKTNIEIFNIAGTLIRKTEVQTEIGNNNIEILRKGLSTGLYFVKVSNDFRTYETKKMIVD